MSRFLVDANDRWRGTQPCSVDAQILVSGNDHLRRQQTFGAEVRTTTTGRQRLFMSRNSGLPALPLAALTVTVGCSPKTCRWAAVSLGARMTTMWL